jgi:Fe-S-cluster-containing hydrogenase component 2
MTPLTDDLIRLEVGRLLRDDYRGKTICSSCLVTFVQNSFGTPYTKAQIERAVLAVSRSPGALTYSNSFVCHHCEKVRPCLRAPESNKGEG